MPRRPLVAVCLGTDHHQFRRLVNWATSLAVSNTSVDWFVQHGHTALPPGIRGARLLSVHELDALLHRADAVISHGGPGLIMEARAAGHLPIVVPRDPTRGEHVDGHQQRFTVRVAEHGLIVHARSQQELHRAVSQALSTGRIGPSEIRGGAEVAGRFGDLVENLVHRHAIHQP